MRKLVSIITPCYNGEKYIGRFLESVIAQTYAPIELILINDGSTDRTEDIINSYKELLSIHSIDLRYVFMRNSGQAAAINEGLKLFSGEYLTWPDSDDVLTHDSIEKKVAFLEANDEYEFVRTNATFIKDEGVSEVLYDSSEVMDFSNERIFEDLILEKNVIFCPGIYMISRVALEHSLPSNQIYASRGGQNWQILLPVAFNYKCGYVNESLYHYMIRPNSHSRLANHVDDQLDKLKTHEKIIKETIGSIKSIASEKYFEMVDHKYNRQKFKLYCGLNKYPEAMLYFRKLNKRTFKDYISIILARLNVYTLVKSNVSGGRFLGQ
ncbi:glycosyltransferase family A protein [Vibrio owensii]|uniref:glycosyltransferase family A protein n=1 Tax=Vibrio owensii TaxID=696485 RepID=UPI003DA05F39